MIKSLFNKVVVVVNSSETSIQAVEYAVAMAKIYRCALKALYVVDTSTIKQLVLSKFFVKEESAEYEESLIQDGTRYLQHAEKLALAKGISIETELRKGAIWTEVTSASEDFGADVILLGGFEKPGVDQRDVISQAYRKILTHAHCSVLVVKDKDVEKLYKNI